MSGLSGGLTSRLLKPLVKHLTRSARRPPPASSSGGRPPSRTYEETKQFARDVWRSTFGQLEREPVYETIPLRRPGGRTLPGGKSWPGGGQYRDLHSGRTGANSSGSSLARSTRFVGTRIRPGAQPLRGPGMVAHTGLHPSPARTFATYGHSHVINDLATHVPLGMRALADRIKRGDDKKQRLAWRKKMIETGTGGRVAKSLKKFEKSVGGSRFGLLSIASIADKEDGKVRRAREYKRYFTRPESDVGSIVAVDAVATPRVPTKPQEPARDSNKTTYLLLPLAPSLSHLLSLPTPTPTSMDNADSYFNPTAPPSLLSSLLPMHEAYDAHAQTHLFPLLENISREVVLGSEDAGWLRTEETVDVEIVLGAEREPEALRLVFRGWTESGVRDLVARASPASEDVVPGEWFHLYSISITSSSARRGNAHEYDEGASTCSLDLSALSSVCSLAESTGPSSYATSIAATDDDRHVLFDSIEETLGMEEQGVWRMPVLDETGMTYVPVLSSSVSSTDGESDLEWVEERVWRV